VRLLARDEIPPKIDTEIIWLFTQQLTYAMEKKGTVGVVKIIASIFTSEPEQAKALAYRLFTIAERKGWAQEAYAYNSLVIAWPEIQAELLNVRAQRRNAKQMTMFGSDGD
jgi:putative DNA methylase